MKKFLAIFLMACMMLAMVPAGVYAADAVTDAEAPEAAIVAKIGEQGYASLEDAVKAATATDIIEIIVAGTYKVPNTGAATLNIKGNADGVVAFDMTKAVGAGSRNYNFENVTFNYGQNLYTGIQHSGIINYTNCVINNLMFSYSSEANFTGCTFNQEKSEYNIWTYGSPIVRLTNCTFNGMGKAVLVYNEGACTTDLTVTNCKFIASAPSDNKAAIEIDTTLMKKHLPAVSDIVIDAATTVTGFDVGEFSNSSLWHDKKDQTNLTVTVAGTKVWPLTAEQRALTVTFDGGEGATVTPATIDVEYSKSLTNAEVTALPTAEKSGYQFLGWFIDGEELTLSRVFYTDVTATAKWAAVIENEEEADVIVDAPEHNVNTDNLTVPEDSTVSEDDLIESANNLEVGSDAIQNAAVDSVEDIMDDVDTKDDKDYIVKPTIDVDLQSYSESTDEEGNVDKEIVYDVTPKYEVYETEPGTNDIPEDAKPVAEGKLNVTEPVMVRIEIPEGYAEVDDIIYITHEKDNGEIYIYDLKVKLDTATGKLYVEFLNENGFSLIIVNTLPTSYPAKIVRTRNTAYFKSLANAVSNVNNGETIELTSENSENITVDGVVSFNIKGEFTGNITVARGLEVKTRETANGLEVVVDIYHAPMVPLFFGTTVRVYDAANGTITPNGIPMIIGGMTKTFKFIPDEGFEVADVIVNGQSIGAAESYTIDGWQGYVTLTAVFEEIAESEEIEP